MERNYKRTIENTFKYSDWLFKIVTWSIVTAAMKFAYEKTENDKFYYIYALCLCTISIVTSNFVTSIAMMPFDRKNKAKNIIIHFLEFIVFISLAIAMGVFNYKVINKLVDDIALFENEKAQRHERIYKNNEALIVTPYLDKLSPQMVPEIPN